MNDLFSTHAYQGKTETSKAAAEFILPMTGTLRRKVYDFIEDCGKFGATDYEIQKALDIKGSTQRPRRKELKDAGAIKDSGMKRSSKDHGPSIVWVTT